MALFGDSDIEITCPHCGHKFSKRLRQLQADPRATCGKCGGSVSVDTKTFTAEAAKLEKALRKFGR